MLVCCNLNSPKIQDGFSRLLPDVKKLKAFKEQDNLLAAEKLALLLLEKAKATGDLLANDNVTMLGRSHVRVESRRFMAAWPRSMLPTYVRRAKAPTMLPPAVLVETKRWNRIGKPGLWRPSTVFQILVRKILFIFGCMFHPCFPDRSNRILLAITSRPILEPKSTFLLRCMFLPCFPDIGDRILLALASWPIIEPKSTFF